MGGPGARGNGEEGLDGVDGMDTEAEAVDASSHAAMAMAVEEEIPETVHQTCHGDEQPPSLGIVDHKREREESREEEMPASTRRKRRQEGEAWGETAEPSEQGEGNRLDRRKRRRKDEEEKSQEEGSRAEEECPEEEGAATDRSATGTAGESEKSPDGEGDRGGDGAGLRPGHA